MSGSLDFRSGVGTQMTTTSLRRRTSKSAVASYRPAAITAARSWLATSGVYEHPALIPGHPRLLVSGPGAPGAPGGEQHTYELQTPVTLLGRGTDCDLRLVDPGVSRHHAELRVENDQVVLVDLGSTNGTFVNGQPIRRVALTDGTHVSLGRTTLIFRQDGPDRDDGRGSAYSRTSY